MRAAAGTNFALLAGTADLTVVQLARVPLGFRTVGPASATSAAGAMLKKRGSGFENGANVTVGGKTAAVTFVDMSTIRVVALAGAH